MKKLTVIIPIYNEANTCEELICKVQEVPVIKQIIVIDDGSDDGTTEILKSIPDIQLIQHETNQGKGASIQSATPFINGDYVILQDGDLEYDPNDYPIMLAPLLDKKADTVFGSRWLDGKNKLTFHYMGNRILTFISNVVNGANITDMASCYKLMSAKLFQSLELKSKGFGIDAEITAKLFKGGYNILEVPISYKGRGIEEGKKIRLRDGIIALWSCIRFRFGD